MSVKKVIKKVIGKNNIDRISYGKDLYRRNKKANKNETIIETLLKTKIIKNKNIKSEQIYELFSKVAIKSLYENFYYYIDVYKKLYLKNMIIDNLTFDYNFILNNSLEDMKKMLENNHKNENFYKEESKLISAIEMLINRIISKLNTTEGNETKITHLNNIKNKKATSFVEALQRILFFNQILWQTGHKLNGLGRLDVILQPYYNHDLQNNLIDKEKAKKIIKEFISILHHDYYYKSSNISGDTGQIMILGGMNSDGSYFYNELTYMFIELMEKMQLPDPKVFLRVTDNTPRDLIEKSLKCIQTGIGCPVLANDDVIIDKLIKFGYEEDDAYNYTTAACWEPFIAGNSFDINNIKTISFMKPIQNMLEHEELEKINSFDNFKEALFAYIKKYIEDFISEVNEYKWEKDPILSLATNNCIINNKDISEGGAKYNHYGFTGVGLSNLVNSIIIVNKHVYAEKKYTLEEFNNIIKNNFENDEALRKEIKDYEMKYGKDNEEVIDISNSIIRYTTGIFNKYTNPLGGKYKFGLSAPSYIEESRDFPASFDGRKKGEPFAVHISSDNSNAYTELIQFASKLDYGENRFNGNVVDFFVTPNFINDNFDKFVDFLMLSIKTGFFEMQMNVVSSKTLIEARNNPEKFPNLIVRVWGFSAYFKDLPDEYKDYLIERALKSEGNS